ncbi:uncharacterized protein LOC116167141 [Photinus pyralis]|uniref:uncharacterized protein LOC116167141 n=1 Tax=Photinus pyralis TaxID=7054 RepID=UPI0012671463|nr:uncharacterized protein LOC116167141 [Photinus pyralis]
MNAKDQTIKRKLTKTRNDIKRKLAALKRGETETFRLVEETYKPIVDPLKALAKHELKKPELIPKIEKKIEYESTPMREQFTTPRRAENTAITTPSNFPPDISEIALNEEKEDSEPEETSISNLSQQLHFLDEYHHLPRQYIERLIRDTTGDTDNVYGLRYDPGSNEWVIGDSTVAFEGQDISIKDTLYTGTPGLYELLVLKKPKSYSFKDRQLYKDILLATNAYKRNYDPRQQMMGTKSYKYVNIIKPLLSEHFGAGMMKEVNDKLKEYVYWNTPHELVERLRLLHASQAAGHTGHNNEILSIEEELREEGIIA